MLVCSDKCRVNKFIQFSFGRNVQLQRKFINRDIYHRYIQYTSKTNVNDDLDKAVDAMYVNHNCGMAISNDSIYHLLGTSVTKKDILYYRKIHALVLSIESSSMNFLYDSLISVFALCGSFLDAVMVFMSVSSPTVHTWCQMIFTHVILDMNMEALMLYAKMLKEGFEPNKSVYICVLKACNKLKTVADGRVMHNHFVESGIKDDVVTETSFINFYAKIGILADAHAVFDRLKNKSVVSWGALIAGYVQHGHGHAALRMYEKMQIKNVIPDYVVYSCTLKACGSVGVIQYGQLIHDNVLRNCFESNVVLANAVIDMYVKCGAKSEARKVFDNLPNKSAISWATLFAGYADSADGYVACELYREMEKKGVKPNTFIFSSMLNICGKLGALDNGRILHDNIVRCGIESDLVVRNTLIDMYAKCRALNEAHFLFETSPNKDEISWGTIISGYVLADDNIGALQVFEKMQHKGTIQNEIIISSVLQACGNIGALREGRILHNQILLIWLELGSIIGSTLVDMYAKCGSIEESIKVFNGLHHKTLSSWGAVINGCASHNTHGSIALELFERMIQQGMKPNIIIYSSVIKACASLGFLEKCMLMHNEIISNGVNIDVMAGNILVAMYIKFESVKGAHKVFDSMSNTDVVTWNSLILGYIQHDLHSDALQLYHDMQKNGVKSDRITFLCALKSISSSGFPGLGRIVHVDILQSGVDTDLSINNALMDMYCKCGHVHDAERMFVNMDDRDIVSWGIIISGYAQQGNYHMVQYYFQSMRNQGIMPDEVIFMSILTVCRQSGQMTEAHRFFVTMREDAGIAPNLEHFNCMVDTIARLGSLSNAEQFLNSMPFQVDAKGWTSLLTACTMYGNSKLGRKCFDQAVLIEPDCASGYVLMSNLCGDDQMV